MRIKFISSHNEGKMLITNVAYTSAEHHRSICSNSMINKEEKVKRNPRSFNLTSRKISHLV